MARPRLLAVGEGLAPTGYARVMEGLLPELCGAFEVVLFAVNHRGAPDPRPFTVRTNTLPGDVCGHEQLPGLLEEFTPKLVLLHRDSTFHYVHRRALAAYRLREARARVVVYSPADWPEPPRAAPVSLVAADRLVLYTRAGQANMIGAFRAAGLQAPPMAIIGHGVDSEAFAPLVPGDRDASRREARRRLFPHEPGIEHAFIALNANRNQRRKRVDLTLRGFALFAPGRPEARLYLHMGMRDMGCDVRRLAVELGIRDRLLTTTRDDGPPAVDDERLNLIYNACDVGVNTAAAESWGLVSFEHAATGAPQIVPGTGASAELWEGHALLLPTARQPDGASLVSPEDLAVALTRLHDDPRLRASLSARGYSLATAPRLRWATIARRWKDLLREL